MQLMSIEDLAAYLGVSKRTIYKYVADGDCPPYIKLSTKNISFDRADVDAWLESKKVYPPNTTDGATHPGTLLQKLAWTPRARNVLDAASAEARRNGLAQMGTEHLLIGILSVKECLGAVILDRLGISQETCRHRYEEMSPPSGKQIRGQIPPSEDVDKVLQCAQDQANQWGHTYLGAEHLLAGILLAQRGRGFQILADLGVTPDLVRAETAKLIVCHQSPSK
jgi:excisionase family DNA binding protein